MWSKKSRKLILQLAFGELVETHFFRSSRFASRSSFEPQRYLLALNWSTQRDLLRPAIHLMHNLNETLEPVSE